MRCHFILPQLSDVTIIPGIILVTKRKASKNIPAITKDHARLKPPQAADAPFPIIAVGASAGGLEAFTKLLATFPDKSGMAIILVQHLDPLHKSMMAELLAAHTRMPVREVIEDMRIEPDNVYVIAPGTYLAVSNGILSVSKPKDRHGARMPFDFLLQSLAASYAERVISVVFSGNGDDGSLGSKAVQNAGGLVIAQDPAEASNSGMPQNAIDLGVVDVVLPIAKIPGNLIKYVNQIRLTGDPKHTLTPEELEAEGERDLAQITDFLRDQLGQDFTSYKPGTLLRRIRRRMALHALNDIDAYVSLLSGDPKETGFLAKDLLIHVTSFFRDKAVFNLLADSLIPQLVLNHSAGHAIRVWVPACSTGEEVYSLAMIFLEKISEAKKNIKLQIFGSDIDEHAILVARTGVYPASIEAEISPERLSRFFIRDADNYRIAPSLREAVIFTVQDVLNDPPFARIDFVSCRNLLIYLLPDIQQQVLSLLHFSLQRGGILLLGMSESIGAMRNEFEDISTELRVFRRTAISHKLNLPRTVNGQPRAYWPRATSLNMRGDINLKEAAHQLLLDSYAPAAVLVNHKNEGLYYFGSTDNYLQLPKGDASNGLFAMARQGLRNKLRLALQQARTEQTSLITCDAAVRRNGVSIQIQIEVRPLVGADNELLLVSFIDKPDSAGTQTISTTGSLHDASRTSELENAIDALQKELQDTTRELEISSADQEAINEEAQSLNEEFQSANEELETSKEELQSLNEELSALNAQLTATVNQQRSTADDLENILRSSELAIVFLDPKLNIRFFSPALKSLLNIIDSDVGRPIGDLAQRFDDANLLDDVRSVLQNQMPENREIRAHGGAWFTRRALPYRTQTGLIQGVVLTFTNISDIKTSEQKIRAERAYVDRILDTVRQPLVVVDEQLLVVTANTSFCRTFSVSPSEITGQEVLSLAKRMLDFPVMNTFLDRAIAESAPIEEYEIVLDIPRQGRRILLVSSRRIISTSETKLRLLLAFDDITQRKLASDALNTAKAKAESANLGKSRFLAAASHDLRQPLQTLSLLHGLLARKTTDADSLELISKLNETLGAMSGMLDTLLDINQLEAGTVQPEIDNFPINEILENLKTEFSYLTKSKGLSLRTVESSLSVRSDPLLLVQMIRNLLSNAIKYTKRGKVLLGCRRYGNKVRIVVCDTGIGIPAGQLKAIFDEYHQLGNPARERGLGLGLGLSIVQRLGDLLDHQISVRSVAGKGSSFTIEVPLEDTKEKESRAWQFAAAAIPKAPPVDASSLLIVEDDPTVRDALELLFIDEGYQTATAISGIEVEALLQSGNFVPDVVIADYNLPGERTGLEVVKNLRSTLKREIPALILTGDIATEILRRVVAAGCGYLHKPVNLGQLIRRVGDMAAVAKKAPGHSIARNPAPKEPEQGSPIIHIVDDDIVLLESMRDMLQQRGYDVEIHANGVSFLAAYQHSNRCCLIVDSVMPEMSGLQLLERLKYENRALPSIVITGHGDITMAINAMKAGAMDFIEKPVLDIDLLASIERALAVTNDSSKRTDAQMAAAASIAALTPRERAVMDLVVGGLPNKLIAHNLKISQRTVETHRAAVMKRTGAASLADLIRLVMRAS